MLRHFFAALALSVGLLTWFGGASSLRATDVSVEVVLSSAEWWSHDLWPYTPHYWDVYAPISVTVNQQSPYKSGRVEFYPTLWFCHDWPDGEWKQVTAQPSSHTQTFGPYATNTISMNFDDTGTASESLNSDTMCRLTCQVKVYLQNGPNWVLVADTTDSDIKMFSMRQ